MLFYFIIIIIIIIITQVLCSQRLRRESTRKKRDKKKPWETISQHERISKENENEHKIIEENQIAKQTSRAYLPPNSSLPQAVDALANQQNSTNNQTQQIIIITK